MLPRSRALCYGRAVVRLPLLSLMLVTVAGCPAVDPAAGLPTTAPPDSFLDYNGFVCTVQPVLIKRCSYLACHGNEGHALRVYSLGKLRFGDTSTRAARSQVQLSADEVERNFASASGMVYGASLADRQSLRLAHLPLLAKPLAARAGGEEHLGVAVFPTYPNVDVGADPEYLALAAWVQGAPYTVDARCKTLLDTMGLKPR